MLSRSLISVAAMLVAALMLHPPVSGSESSQAVKGRALVAIDDSSANLVVEVSGHQAFSQVVSHARANGLRVDFSSENTGILTLDAKDLKRGDVDSIASLPGVVSVSSEHKARALFTPNDPGITFQWGLDTVNAYEAWDISRGSHDVVIAVLDTGVDWTHPDIAGNIWSDANGYHGYNFIANNRVPMDDNVNSYDENGVWQANQYTYHGTHVAGIAGAVMNNGVGVAGMAQASLMAVKVMNDSGEGTDSTVASGIRWAVDNGADIITMSLGVDGASTVLGNAVSYASSHGVVMVAASGNSGSSYVSYPAAYPAVIAVGAVDSSMNRASFSNFGNNLDLMAPGVMIYSTQGGGANYQSLSGTSTAAPYVAGVAALMLSVNPALTPMQIGQVLNSTATDRSISGLDATTGWGVVNAFAAVQQVSNPMITVTNYPDVVDLNSTFSVTWVVSGGNPGTISSTYVRYGLSASNLVQTSQNFSGTTWAEFTAADIEAPDYNTTLFLRVYAMVDGTAYQSDLISISVENVPSNDMFSQFIRQVQNFIFNDLGFYNFLIILGLLIAIPAIAVAVRPRRRQAAARQMSQASPIALQQMHPLPVSQYVPPPPPPPRFEAYVDVMGQDVMPVMIKIVEGTKVVWVNRSWAPPPGISIRSGRLDQAGEHPDGTFQSGMLIAPGDYWSATFHRAGVYEYYLTGIWKNAKIIVEPFKPGTTYGPHAA